MMEKQYLCKKEDDSWVGTIHILNPSFPTEMMITGRGFQFHVIYGKHQNGYYAVIPEWNIGCEMTYNTDVFWNRESLIQAGLGVYEAETVSKGISQIEFGES